MNTKKLLQFLTTTSLFILFSSQIFAEAMNAVFSGTVTEAGLRHSAVKLGLANHVGITCANINSTQSSCSYQGTKKHVSDMTRLLRNPHEAEKTFHHLLGNKRVKINNVSITKTSSKGLPPEGEAYLPNYTSYKHNKNNPKNIYINMNSSVPWNSINNLSLRDRIRAVSPHVSQVIHREMGIN